MVRAWAGDGGVCCVMVWVLFYSSCHGCGNFAKASSDWAGLISENINYIPNECRVYRQAYIFWHMDSACISV
jgi:hypothetical protein